jgi:hypothetical protein
MFENIQNSVSTYLFGILASVSMWIIGIVVTIWVIIAVLKRLARGPAPKPVNADGATLAPVRGGSFWSIIGKIAIGGVLLFIGVNVYNYFASPLHEADKSSSVDAYKEAVAVQQGLKSAPTLSEKSPSKLSGSGASTTSTSALPPEANIPSGKGNLTQDNSPQGGKGTNPSGVQAGGNGASLKPILGGLYWDLDKLTPNPSLPKPLMTTDAPPRSALKTR